jgi:hypothetical protein
MSKKVRMRTGQGRALPASRRVTGFSWVSIVLVIWGIIKDWWEKGKGGRGIIYGE